MKLLFTLLLFSFGACYGQTATASVKDPTRYEEFYKTIRHQFYCIDSLRYTDYDTAAQLNDSIPVLVERYKEDLFLFPDTLDYDLMYLAKSSDNNLLLVSWDTRLGGTLIAFTTMALYKTPQGIKTQMLLDSTDEDMPFTYMHYNSLQTLTTAEGKKLYLAWGNGQGSTALPWQELRAFALEGDRLLQPEVFPEEDARVFVEFDLHAFRDDEKVPVIRVREDGRVVQVPIAGDNEGFSGKYETYRFNGKVFTKGPRVKASAGAK